jgi:hypothetical protein
LGAPLSGASQQLVEIRQSLDGDFKRVFTKLVETWDQQFPRSDAPLAADREAWELLADRNKLLRRA